MQSISFSFACLYCLLSISVAVPSNLSRTPPQGWMSWQTFRCATNCTAAPEACIDEDLYKEMGDALISTGLAAVGFSSIHLDDCIMDKSGRDPITNELQADPIRFPSGFKALGDYLHSKGLTMAMYTAESSSTCGGWPGSRGFEKLDAQTFAKWGADYLKADGCGDPAYYSEGYALMGNALQNSGRDIVFSCSWPAYLGDDETLKPFGTMINDGCNLWRNYIDMGPTVGYMQGVLEHFGNYSEYLSLWAGPSHWHDPDQLLLGSDAISDDAATSQLALYSILAAPLILGTDIRKMKPSHLALLLNKDVLAINQDSLGKAGIRLGGIAASNNETQVWIRPLANGDVAIALYHAGLPSQHPWHSACDANATNITKGGYFQPLGEQPSSWCFAPGAFGQSLLDWYCCNDDDCAGYNVSTTTGAGCLFKNTDGDFVSSTSDVYGYRKVNYKKPTGQAQVISFDFSSVGLFPNAKTRIYDVFAQKVVLDTNASSYSTIVNWKGTVLLRISQTW